jgi:hypothetical protein
MLPNMLEIRTEYSGNARKFVIFAVGQVSRACVCMPQSNDDVFWCNDLGYSDGLGPCAVCPRVGGPQRLFNVFEVLGA